MKDQQLLSKQMEVTGNAVAQLTLNQRPAYEEEPGSPTSSVNARDSHLRQPRQRQGGPSITCLNTGKGRHPSEDRTSTRSHVPKLAFPRFEEVDARVWKSKCMDFFQLYDVPKNLWVMHASLHMDDNAAKWLQVYKLKYGMDNWDHFIDAVEVKFGANAYRAAMEELMEL